MSRPIPDDLAWQYFYILFTILTKHILCVIELKLHIFKNINATKNLTKI